MTNLKRYLIYDVCRRIYMSYASCQRSSTGGTPQSVPYPSPELFVAFASSATARSSMLYLLAPGLSLSEASPAPQPSCSSQPAQGRLHRKIAHRASPPAAALRRAHSTHVERNREPRLDRHARPRAEAWLNRGHPGRLAQLTSNIISTVCSLSNSPKLSSCWFPTNDGRLATPRR